MATSRFWIDRASSTTASFSGISRLDHMVFKARPGASSMMMYSQPTGLSLLSLHENTFGTGNFNSDRRNSSVATSLAVTTRDGTTRSGILTIRRCSPITARKTLLEAPSASFSNRTAVTPAVGPTTLTITFSRAFRSNFWMCSCCLRSSFHSQRPEVGKERSEPRKDLNSARCN